MSGDGNGWTLCSLGHRHWGRFGAAGLLVVSAGTVMLQHRAAWTHEGGTWALPGGARDSHEDALSAAVREAREETSLDTATVTPFAAWTADHGGWSYTTVLARTDRAVPVHAINAESDAIEWWPVGEVADLDLHAGFAAAWPTLAGMIGSSPPAPPPSS